MIVYCRGCNREFEVHEVFTESYSELIKEEDKNYTTTLHPKIDCDIQNDNK